MSNKRLAEETQLSERTITTCRAALEEKGFVRTRTEKGPHGGTRVHVTLIDIWRENHQFFEEKKTQGTTQQNLQTVNESTVVANFADTTQQNLLAPPSKICDRLNTKTKNNTKTKEEMTPAGRDVGSRMEDSVYSGFVKDETTEPKPDKTAEKFATRLANGLQAKNKIMRWPNIRNWINQFEDWMLETEADPSRVERVLDWYIDNVHHCEENYIPQAYSVKTFCEQFVRIESSMKRLQKPNSQSVEDFTNRLRQTYIQREGMKNVHV